MTRHDGSGATDAASDAAEPALLRIKRWLREHLGWNRIYRATSYLRSALWVVPILAVIAERITYRVLHFLDQWVTWDLTGLDVEGCPGAVPDAHHVDPLVHRLHVRFAARGAAGGERTADAAVIATTLLRDKVIKYSVALNVFTLLFAVHGLNRTDEDGVPACRPSRVLLGIACLASFLFFIDYAARLLRPVNIVALVCDQGMEVIRSVYPRDGAETKHVADADQRGSGDEPALVVSHKGRALIVLAVEIDALVAEAARVNGVIEFVPQVGDFVAADEPLFRLYGGAATIDEKTLRECVAFGSERTMEQDPMFSFRILADIALKALSPAINDPTTAVLAMDQIHRLLRLVGKRRLHDEVVHDSAGQVRLLLRTPNWDDFVHMAFTEIRACGANNVQIARRMRAMLENLVHSLPESRHAALRQQLDLLERTLPDYYKLPEDLALARVPDSQGLGGASGGRPSV